MKKSLVIAVASASLATGTMASNLNAGESALSFNAQDISLKTTTNTWFDDNGARKITDDITDIAFGMTGRTAATDALTVGAHLAYEQQITRRQDSIGALTTNNEWYSETFTFSPMVEFNIQPNIDLWMQYLYSRGNADLDYYGYLNPNAPFYANEVHTLQELKLGGIYRIEQSEKLALEGRAAIASASLRYENESNTAQSAAWSFFNFYLQVGGNYFLKPELSADFSLNLASKNVTSYEVDSVAQNTNNIDDTQGSVEARFGLSYYFR